MNKKNIKLNNEIVASIIFIIAVIAMSYGFAIERINVVDYNSINGDFQSYNVFRRILDGQTLYVDFSNYIGLAPIIINIPFLLFENTFAQSLFATNFTSCVLFCIAVFVLFKLITKNTYISMAIAALTPKFISSQILLRLLGAKYGYIYTQRFTDLFTPSNSMRAARSFLPFLVIILIVIYIYLKNKKQKTSFILSLTDIKFLFILGVVQGVFILWSNEFGIACIVSMLIIICFLQLFKHKMQGATFLKNICVYIIGAILGLLLITTIVTKGAPQEWFISTANISEYQFFYFSGGGNLLPYIFSMPTLLIFTFVFVCFLSAYLYMLIKNKANDAVVFNVFIILSILGATYIYIIGGSGYNLREPLEVYVILFITAYIVKGVLYLIERYKPLKCTKKVVNSMSLAFLAILASYYSYLAITFVPSHSGTYSEELGGYTTYDKAIFEASEYIGDGTLFSVYATGLEVVLNQYQPTGYDYIIHALGKDVRKEYVDIFVLGDYDYIQTPSMEVGAWINNANWYFFREVVYNYEKDFQTEYSWIWKKADIQPVIAEIEYEVTKVNENSVRIDVTSDNTDDFISEFKVSYDTGYDGFTSWFQTLGRKAMLASSNITFDQTVYSGIALPASGTEYIPVQMRNGHGSVTLNGVFNDGVTIDVSLVEYTKNYPPMYLYK